MQNNIELPTQKASGKFHISVVENGRVVEEKGWIKNLILDSGLDMVGTNRWVDCFRYCSVGTGTTPTVDDSGATTATQSGTTVTSSSSFFSVGDVGKILKFDSGEEAYITSYTSDTEVEVSVSRTIAVASQFALWRVNQTQLSNYIKRSDTYLSGSANNGTTFHTNTEATHKRTWDFSAESGVVTYNEVGVHYDNVNNPTLFSRILIPGGVTLQAGQQLRIVYELTINYGSDSAQVATANITGWPVGGASSTDGQYQLISNQYFSSVLTNGNSSTSSNGADPNNSKVLHLHTASSFPSFNGTPSGSTYINLSSSRNPYISGSFKNDWDWDLQVSQGNGANIRSFILSDSSIINNSFWMFIFDEAQTKQNTHRLFLRFSVSWGRVLGDNP